MTDAPAQPHKLPLTPHVWFSAPRLAPERDGRPRPAPESVIADLIAELAEARERIAHLTAANRELSGWVADLEAEVLETRSRGPFIPVTLGCL